MKKNSKIQDFITDIFFGGRQYKTKNAEGKSPLPIKTVLLAVTTTALLLTLMFSLIQISELTSGIASLKKNNITLAAKEDSLRSDIEHKYSYTEIEQMLSELGYVEGGGRVVIIDPDAEETEETADSEEDPSKEENEP